MSTDSNGYQQGAPRWEQGRLSKLLELGVAVTDGEFYHLWNYLLRDWFPIPNGWAVYQERLVESSPAFRVAVTIDANGVSIQDGGFNRAVGMKLALVGVVKSSVRWNEEGKEAVLKELEAAMSDCRLESGVSVVWGIAGIGFHWVALRQEDATRPQIVADWRSDVLSLDSWQAMKHLTETIKQSI
ncbi:hypothetical protein FRC04_009475 [Tulasnella sp. 424]|nr:hypothetical protein FRC04_009475 [Tulasnella sp. 424]KAG8971196.1 hypothetical protein FRC05_011390 [Tulasnella sp. 425]